MSANERRPRAAATEAAKELGGARANATEIDPHSAIGALGRPSSVYEVRLQREALSGRLTRALAACPPNVDPATLLDETNGPEHG